MFIQTLTQTTRGVSYNGEFGLKDFSALAAVKGEVERLGKLKSNPKVLVVLTLDDALSVEEFGAPKGHNTHVVVSPVKLAGSFDFVVQAVEGGYTIVG